jgi:predicted N-acetyltransferase YhbS
VFSDDAGIGSIAVAPENRGRGLATRLIRGVLKRLDRRGFKRVFLFSDIAARFYEPFGFKPLPARHQKRPGSVCMVRARSTRRLLAPGFTPPDYF